MSLENMFCKKVILWKQRLHQRIEKCRVYNFSGLASFGQLGLISDPQISSKGRETFNSDHTIQITIMSGRSDNLSTLLPGRLRPPKWLTSTSCTYFRQ